MGMHAEDLKGWKWEAKSNKDPVIRRWELTVRLVHMASGDRNLLEDLAWVKMFLLQKGKWEYQGIILVEVTWKVCSAAVNSNLKQSIELHNRIHRFREGQETETATLYANLVQKMAGLANKPLL